jgi:hypothetical protein
MPGSFSALFVVAIFSSSRTDVLRRCFALLVIEKAPENYSTNGCTPRLGALFRAGG